ncbi:MAG: protein translocase subunit SecF [Thermomicrobiaceae bacterium]
MLDLVGKRYLWFLLSLIMILPGLASLAVNGLQLGIDFTGGTLWEIEVTEGTSSAEIQDVLQDQGYSNARVQESDDNEMLIRMEELQQGSPEKSQLDAAIEEEIGAFTDLQLQSVGPTLGSEIRDRAILAIGLASVGVLLYIAYAFRKTQNAFLYGSCAIIAMVHDIALVVGIFSILGWVGNVEVDSLFVTAVLTLVGFSVHDTIVVFDRIRENLVLRAGDRYEDIVNYSIVQTVPRSINTSITTLFTLLALYLFGGATIQLFILALIIGIAAGTYSSIFNAAQILVVWENREIHDFFARLLGKPQSHELPDDPDDHEAEAPAR